MELTINNCNSIDEASISIDDGLINIKYGVNGVGKSTIAKAIELECIKKWGVFLSSLSWSYDMEDTQILTDLSTLQNE